MIARLKGILEEKQKDRIIVDVHGVGYGLHVPETVFLRLPETGCELALEVHTHVREDHITLYGFLSRLEKDVFELLMSASGVGPKLALTVLSSLDAQTILEAVSGGDKSSFNGISGVGKKTVEKLFVEIRDKAEKRLRLERGEASGQHASANRRGGMAPAPAGGWGGDLEKALLGLGYKEPEIRLALRELAGSLGVEADFDRALRGALALLSGVGKGSLRGTA